MGREAESSMNARRLAERVRLYEAVLATGPLLVHVYDEQMNSRWSSASLRPELGHSPAQELTAEENFSLVHPEDLPEARLDAERVRSGDPGPKRIRVRDASGEYRWLSILSVNLLDDPDVGSILVHAWDITSEVEREEEIDAARRRLAALIDTLEEAVIVVSGDIVTYANPRVAELFPTVGSHEEVVGKRAADLRAAFAQSIADPEEWLESGQRAIDSGEPVRRRLVETADGRTLEQTFVPIHVGDRETSRMWVYRDVTAQQQLQRRREEVLRLEREARLGAEEQNEKLRELDDLRVALVATASHELRTPLSAVSSYLGLLLDLGADPLTDEQRRIATAAERGVRRLSRLVDELLFLAQLQAGSMQVERETVDVPALVGEAIDELQQSEPDGVEIVFDAGPGPTVRSDRARLLQIVTNLLTNARKYADRRVECSARFGDGEWTIEVRDDGEGLSAKELERAFEPFFSGRRPQHSSMTSAGLGLAISAELATLLGASVTLENAPGGGAVARLFVPRLAPAPAEPGSTDR